MIFPEAEVLWPSISPKGLTSGAAAICLAVTGWEGSPGKSAVCTFSPSMMTKTI